MVQRINLATAVARNGDGYAFDYPLPDGSPAEVVDRLIAKISLVPFSDETRNGAIEFIEGLQVNDNWRSIVALAYLLASPEFLKH